MAAIVSDIRIYPIKSLDPVVLNSAPIGMHSLKNDRIFAMKTEDGRFVNGKRTGRVNQLHTKYDLENMQVSFSERDSELWDSFELDAENPQLIQYLQDFFKLPLFLEHNTDANLLDVPKRSCVTIVSEASLLSLKKTFPELSLEDLRLRFRTNIEIKNVDAYWEEQLFDTPKSGVRFSIGDVNLIGMTPRARCNVPPRNPLNGETDKSFVKKMMKSRADNLPKNSTLALFGNEYHLTVDCYIPPPEMGKSISCGDELKIHDIMHFQ